MSDLYKIKDELAKRKAGSTDNTEIRLLSELELFANSLDDGETTTEKELLECYLKTFDKKFTLPKLKGKELDKYKNFLNRCQQLFGLKKWGIHPTQAKLFEKLSLLWAVWGAENLQDIKNATKPVIFNEEFVDLGLPSGTLWTKYNLGAETETDFGLYFQWGDTQGYVNAVDHDFSWTDYKYGTESKLKKYNDSDQKKILDNEDDVVYGITNGKFKMPTFVQLQELIDETDHLWKSFRNGVNGMKFINKKDSSKYIFIPAAGYYHNGCNANLSAVGYIWSTNVGPVFKDHAWRMYFGYGGIGMFNHNRCDGYNIRGIVNNKK